MAYLKGEYGRALGICEAALMFRDDVYPISMIYLYCMIAMCQMNLKNQQKAKDALMLAWNVAIEDEFGIIIGEDDLDPGKITYVRDIHDLVGKYGELNDI